MTRTIATAAFVAALASPPAIAHPVGFRNPVAAPAAGDRAALGAMIALQAWDAINSARHMRLADRREVDPEFSWAAHRGAGAYALTFAVADVLELAAARALHIHRSDVFMYQAEQSATGILTTNIDRPVMR